MQKVSIILFIILYLSISTLFAQILLRGKVISKSTQKPVPFANIGVLGEALGTSSDAQGNFRLLLPQKFANATLHVSSVGYQSQDFALAQLTNARDMRIYLPEAIRQLAEIEVKANDDWARKLVARAAQRRSENDADFPYDREAFAREIVQEDGRYTGFAEGVGKFHSEGYHPERGSSKGLKWYAGDWCVLFQARYSNYLTPLSGNGKSRTFYLPNLHDRFDDHFFLSNLRYWDFRYLGKEVASQDDTLYVVSFRPLERYRKRLKPRDTRRTRLDRASGTFYIRKQDLAFVQVDYQITGFSPTANKWWRYKVQGLGERGSLHFKQIKGKYYLQYYQQDTRYRCFGFLDKPYAKPKEIYNQRFLWLSGLDAGFKDRQTLEKIYAYGSVGNRYPFRFLNVGIARANSREFVQGPIKPEYDRRFWENYQSPSCANMMQIRQDLENQAGKSLEQQFEEYYSNEYLLQIQVKNRKYYHPRHSLNRK